MFISRGQPSTVSGALNTRLLLPAFFLLMVSWLNGCNLQQSLHRLQLGDLGHFEYRTAQAHMAGVVIGAPHGFADAKAVLLAKQISGRTGAGLVAAYGFKSKRISVTQPISRIHAQPVARLEPAKRRSVFPEFKQVIREVSNGEIDLYVELRFQKGNDGFQGIEVASSGFTFEEARIIEQSYAAVAEHVGRAEPVAKLPLWIDHSNKISMDTWGIRHHGVLMIAEKGLSVRIPEKLLSERDLDVFGEILTAWIKELARLVHENPRGVPQIQARLLDFGRLDIIPSRAERTGLVIGAPHGSCDAHTAGIARQLAFRTGWAAVVARGFTPTESGDGRRIHVNRPTEGRFSLSEREFETERARATYAEFKSSVLSAAQGNLDLYIDIHHNDGSHIEVASMGLSRAEARLVKDAYRAARDEVLARRSDTAIIDLAIEPLDEITVGAWAAKTNGILALAHRSLHFELPANGVMSFARQRQIYTTILGQLIAGLPAALGLPVRNLRCADLCQQWARSGASSDPR